MSRDRAGPPAREPREITDFWFAAGMEQRWFRSTPAFDDEVRQRFETTWQQAATGALEHWAQTARGALALVIVLDQFPLNMYRGEPRSFATEQQAVRVTLDAVGRGLDRELAGPRQAFLYMPLMHSEQLEHQDLSVQLFERAGLEDNARFARHHRELIRRFGRFPHRNAILGREDTADERAYLASKSAFRG